MKEQQPTILEFGVQAFTLTTYTSYENTILMRIIANCQKDIADAITSQKKFNHIVFRPNENAEQMRHVKLSFHCLEPCKSHYSRLRLALESMTKKELLIPFFQHNHAMSYMKFPRLFDVSFVIENKRQYVILHVPLEVLRYYLSNAMGYHRLYIHLFFMYNHYATRQTYRLYKAYFIRNGRKLAPQFIAQSFSLTGNYNSYAAVAKNLLEPARQEMKKAYDNGLSDFYFRYKALYGDNEENGSRQTWADRVLFTFIHRDDEHPEGEKLEELTTYQSKTKTVLKVVWGVDDGVAESLSRRITYPMLVDLDEFFNHVKRFTDKMRRQGKVIRNPAAYIRKSLEAFLEEKEKE